MEDLIQTYNLFQETPSTLNLTGRDLIQPGLWTHFDPRLMEIWIAFTSQHWVKINPILFNQEILQCLEPSTFGVLLSQCELLVDRRLKKLFRHWMQTSLCHVIPHSACKLYFIGVNQFAGKEMQRDRDLSLNLYFRWGYLGRDIAIHKAQKSLASCLKKEDRLRLLKDFVKKLSRVTVKEYLAVLANEYHLIISQRQGERDFASIPQFKKRDRTKGAYYARSRSN